MKTAAIEHERRTSPRIEINGAMTYRIGDDAERLTGEIENMSAAGVRIWIERKLPLGTLLHIRIASDQSDDAEIDIEVRLLRQMPELRGSLIGYGCQIEYD